MSVIVEMFRDAGVPRGRNRFACPLPIWEFLSELGRSFGWDPQGTTYVVSPDSTVEAPARRNYQPGGSQDHKQVAGEDAAAWARALDIARASAEGKAVIQARCAAVHDNGSTAGDLLPGVLAEFIEFAYGGAFEFAIHTDPCDSQDRSR